MALHIALMNIAAPLGAVLLARKLVAASNHPIAFWAVTIAQIVLLWMWHAPSMQSAALGGSHVLQAIMHASLFVVALLFWSSLLRLSAAMRWQAIAALMVTGKLSCLLAALLIFAPRLLHEMPLSPPSASQLPSALADQQLAGLLMISACPLSYLVAAVVFAAQIIGDLRSTSGAARTFSTLR